LLRGTPWSLRRWLFSRFIDARLALAAASADNAEELTDTLTNLVEPLHREVQLWPSQAAGFTEGSAAVQVLALRVPVYLRRGL